MIPLAEELSARALAADGPGRFQRGFAGCGIPSAREISCASWAASRRARAAAMQAFFRAVFALLLWFPANLNAISDAMVAILKIVAVLLALILVFVIARGVYKKTGIVIMPFEVSLGEGQKINGRAISDLLAGELRRIYGYAGMFGTEGLLVDLQKPNKDTPRPSGASRMD